jgi:antitoxin component of MazEF toxin-antitoxin module
MGVSDDSCKVEKMGAVSLVLLIPDGQAVMIKVEYLDAIPAAVDEEEEMAVEEILAEALRDEAREAVEALPHVDRSGAKERADGRGE